MRWRGFLSVAAAATLWGISGVVARALFLGAVRPEAVIEIRLTASVILMLIIFRLRGQPVRLPREVTLRLIPLGVAMVIAQSTYYLTISLSNVTTAIFLQYTAPAVVTAYTTLVQRQRLSLAQAACVVGAIAGGYFLVAGPQGLAVSPAAMTTGTISAVAFSAWVIMGRNRARTVGPWEMLLYGLGTGAVLWSLYIPPWRAYVQPHTLSQWGLLAFIIVAATLVPFVLFLNGLRFVDSRTASLTAMLEPVVAASAAALLLGEALTLREGLGATLILASVIMLQLLPGERSATGATTS